MTKETDEQSILAILLQGLTRANQLETKRDVRLALAITVLPFAVMFITFAVVLAFTSGIVGVWAVYATIAVSALTCFAFMFAEDIHRFVTRFLKV